MGIVDKGRNFLKYRQLAIQERTGMAQDIRPLVKTCASRFELNLSDDVIDELSDLLSGCFSDDNRGN